MECETDAHQGTFEMYLRAHRLSLVRFMKMGLMVIYTRRMHKQDKGAEVTSKLSKSMVDVWWIVRLEVTFLAGKNILG